MERPPFHETGDNKLEKANQELRLRINQLEEGVQLKDFRIRELELRIQELEKEVKEAIIDHLTGLRTRRYFEAELDRYIEAINSEQSREMKDRRKEDIGFDVFGLLFCDIDDFKKINDTYGHKAGDEVLKVVSQIIQAQIRDLDIASRWGGEEIVVALLGAEEEAAVQKAEEIRHLVEEESARRFTHYPDLKISLSIGTASFYSGLTLEEVIRRADSAMYEAKKGGKNRVESYQEKNKA